MSLQTDSIFIKALQSDDALMQTIGGRLYGTAIPMPEEDALNEPVPYLIVFYDGMQNDTQTKDDPYEGDSDRVQVSVACVAKTLADLHSLTSQVRTVIHDYFVRHREEDAEIPYDYQLSAKAIQYDELKPCYNQELNYSCETINQTLDDHAE